MGEPAKKIIEPFIKSKKQKKKKIPRGIRKTETGTFAVTLHFGKKRIQRTFDTLDLAKHFQSHTKHAYKIDATETIDRLLN